MRAVLLALVVLGGLAAGSQAAVVNLSIASASAGTYQVYASVSSDTAGLSSFILNVTADSGLAITSSLNTSPKFISATTFQPVGFQQSAADGVNGIGVQAGQVSAYAGPPSAANDAKVLQNVGILAGASGPAFPAPISWAAPVLLASGTYSGTAGWLHVRVGNGQFNLLSKVGGGAWVGPGNVIGPVPVTLTGADLLIPEPATMLLVLGGAVAMVIRRRR